MSPGALPRQILVRNQRLAALTILDVMIALMVLAILLAGIASSWFTLRTVQKLTQDENKVHEIAQTLSERIIGANWDWIGRDRPDELKQISVVDDSVTPTTPPTMKTIDVVERYWRRYAWSWHRREFPRTTGAKVRLPPLTDHDWTPADYARFRADSQAPLTTGDVDHLDMSIPAAQRINPHNLIDLGLVDGPTGLPNLQIYVEYYHASILDALFTQPVASNGAVTFWRNEVKGTGNEDNIFPESPFAIDDPEVQMNSADPTVSLQAMVVRVIVTWGDTPKLFRHELVMARRK